MLADLDSGNGSRNSFERAADPFGRLGLGVPRLKVADAPRQEQEDAGNLPPRGIDAPYDRQVQAAPGAPPLAMHGMIKGPVRAGTLAFNTLETGVAPLATFVGGR